MAQSPRFASQGDPGFSSHHQNHIFVSGEMQEIRETNPFHSSTCRKTQINDTKCSTWVFHSVRWCDPNWYVWLFREGDKLLEFKPLCREDALLTVLFRSRSNLLSRCIILRVVFKEKKRQRKTLNRTEKKNFSWYFDFCLVCLLHKMPSKCFKIFWFP